MKSNMTREIALHCMKSASDLTRELCEDCSIYGQTGSDHCFEDALQYVIGLLEKNELINNAEESEKKYTRLFEVLDFNWVINYEHDNDRLADKIERCKAALTILHNLGFNLVTGEVNND